MAQQGDKSQNTLSGAEEDQICATTQANPCTKHNAFLFSILGVDFPSPHSMQKELFSNAKKIFFSQVTRHLTERVTIKTAPLPLLFLDSRVSFYSFFVPSSSSSVFPHGRSRTIKHFQLYLDCLLLFLVRLLLKPFYKLKLTEERRKKEALISAPGGTDAKKKEKRIKAAFPIQFSQLRICTNVFLLPPFSCG